MCVCVCVCVCVCLGINVCLCVYLRAVIFCKLDHFHVCTCHLLRVYCNFLLLYTPYLCEIVRFYKGIPLLN